MTMGRTEPSGAISGTGRMIVMPFSVEGFTAWSSEAAHVSALARAIAAL